MSRFRWIPFALLFLVGCASNARVPESSRKAAAERFLRGLYGGDESVVSELAAEHIVVSYPAFQDVLGKTAIRGLDAVREFSNRFSRRWENQQITVHEVIAEGDWVAIIWSFQAHDREPAGSDQPQDNENQSWGGITVYQFDTNGKIAVELGEESTPGPYARLSR